MELWWSGIPDPSYLICVEINTRGTFVNPLGHSFANLIQGTASHILALPALEATWYRLWILAQILQALPAPWRLVDFLSATSTNRRWGIRRFHFLSFSGCVSDKASPFTHLGNSHVPSEYATWDYCPCTLCSTFWRMGNVAKFYSPLQQIFNSLWFSPYLLPS